MTKLSKWDVRYLNMAVLASTWSKDPNTQVGAVICDWRNRFISEGLNGFPRGLRDKEEWLNDRDLKLEVTIHAEENAILFAEQDLSNCTMYVFPFSPCSRCAAKIIQVGISRVVAPMVKPDSNWYKNMMLAKAMFEQADPQVDLQLVDGGYDPEKVMREVQEKWAKHRET